MDRQATALIKIAMLALNLDTDKKIAKDITAYANKEVIEGKDVRITYGFDFLTAQELPQKGKKRLRKLNYRVAPWLLPRRIPSSDELIVDNLLRGKLSKGATYDNIKRTLEKEANKAHEAIEEAGGEEYKPNYLYTINEDTVYYLEVEPADFKPLRFENKKAKTTLESSWTSFTLTVSYNDDPYEPSYTAYQQKSKGAARKLYKVLKANPDLAKNITSDKFNDIARKHKIGVSSFSSSWR